MAVFSEKFPPLTAFLVPPYLDDETPKKRPTLYEDLRSRNRENYEVTLTQKADILLKSPAETPVLKRGGDSFPTEICCYWDYLHMVLRMGVWLFSVNNSAHILGHQCLWPEQGVCIKEHAKIR